jgi:REP element-mobilizing transposase RayT
MARPRKRHVQLALPKLDKNGQRRGGKRPGAGRPKSGKRASERHKTRGIFKASEPLHVVIRAADAIGTLRGFKTYHALRTAVVATFHRYNFRIVHLSIQRTHVHLIIEAQNRMALARGMQAFQISAAKHLNAAVAKLSGKRRRGSVFTDRYHVEILRTPRQVRHALAYVLNNWRRHGEHRRAAALARGWRVDPFSSAPVFEGFRDVDPLAIQWPDTYLAMPVWEARTWLLSDGWKKHGLIRPDEMPGPHPALAARV